MFHLEKSSWIPSMVACAGSPATISRKLRQARKGATVAVTSGAGVWLVQAATFYHLYNKNVLMMSMDSIRDISLRIVPSPPSWIPLECQFSVFG